MKKICPWCSCINCKRFICKLATENNEMLIGLKNGPACSENGILGYSNEEIAVMQNGDKS